MKDTDPSSQAAQTTRKILVEDDRTGMDPATLERAVLDHLMYTCSKDLGSATHRDLYEAMSHAVRDRLVYRWIKTQRAYYEADAKRVYYLSAEFLLGRLLAMNLVNLGLYETARETLGRYGIDIVDVLETEHDPGLGNGGLGRLAACFLDSLATLALPGYGYGIRYEFGIFEQEIKDGRQVEHPDAWAPFGTPWELARHEYTVPVRFYGSVTEIRDAQGHPRVSWHDGSTVLGVPYDTPVAGFGNDTVNTLRLWSARASNDFDLQVFNDGDYRRAVEEKSLSESISKVLYPKDDTPEGRELRLKQQYFFVACSVADIIRRYKKVHRDFASLPDKAAIQLNDTHPAITVAELMRVLVDLEEVPWEEAWDITQRTIGYTNHTLLSEALERWPVPLFERLLPRHLQIIYEINQRFLNDVHVFAPGDGDRRRRMSIIEEGPVKQVRMAHLAVVGSHSVNGVAALHSELIKTQLLPDFAALWPERFNNKTNGVTPRRWLLLANPRLATAITRRIGDGWARDLDELAGLAAFVDDGEFHAELFAIKGANKVDLAALTKRQYHLEFDPQSIFDVQVKRLHEYKRQLMNALHILALYRAIRQDPQREVVPRTFLFGGKAAPGYVTAKLHIKLINDIAQVVNRDPLVRGRLKVLFFANYNVSLAEKIIPAADISEQISLAGKEASGTGNMKFTMNGALTVGTLDGANVEIREAVGAENFFLFGLDAAAASALKRGYDPGRYIATSERLQDVIELLESGFLSPDEPGRFAPVAHSLRHDDPYLTCADFDAYLECQERVAAAWRDPTGWARKVVMNLASSGSFSSDRTISQYASDIWKVRPVPVHLDGAARDMTSTNAGTQPTKP